MDDLTGGEKSVNPLRDEASLKRSGKNFKFKVQIKISKLEIQSSLRQAHFSAVTCPGDAPSAASLLELNGDR